MPSVGSWASNFNPLTSRNFTKRVKPNKKSRKGNAGEARRGHLEERAVLVAPDPPVPGLDLWSTPTCRSGSYQLFRGLKACPCSQPYPSQVCEQGAAGRKG